MIQFCFQPNTTWQNCEEPALLCSALWAVLSWAGFLAIRLVGYKRGPKECSPKPVWRIACGRRQQCLEYNNVQRIFSASVLFFCFFDFFFIFYFVLCLLLQQQQQVNQILFNELAPTFDPLPTLLLPPSRARYWHASAAPYRRSRGRGGSGQGVRLVCQKYTATKKN